MECLLFLSLLFHSGNSDWSFVRQVGPDDTESRDQMVAEIRRISRLFIGKHIVCDSGRAGVREEYWCKSEDGIGQVFFRQPYNGKEGYYEQLFYSNGKYSVEILNDQMEGVDRIHCFAIEGDMPNSILVGGWETSLFCGWIGPVKRRVDSLLKEHRGDLKVDSDSFLGGEALPSLIIESDRGRISFGFHDNEVRFLKVDVPCGTRIPTFRPVNKEEVVGEGRPGFAFQRTVIGPIEYDADGMPVRVGFSEGKFAWVRSDGTVEATPLPSVPAGTIAWIRYVEISDLKPGEFDQERIDIEKFGIPSRLKVMVPTSPVPYELRDGKLVKLADARAEEVAHVAGFRQPGVWQRFKYLIVSGLILLTGMIGWYFHRRYTSG